MLQMMKKKDAIIIELITLLIKKNVWILSSLLKISIKRNIANYETFLYNIL